MYKLLDTVRSSRKALTVDINVKPPFRAARGEGVDAWLLFCCIVMDLASQVATATSYADHRHIKASRRKKRNFVVQQRGKRFALPLNAQQTTLLSPISPINLAVYAGRAWWDLHESTPPPQRGHRTTTKSLLEQAFQKISTILFLRSTCMKSARWWHLFAMETCCCSCLQPASDACNRRWIDEDQRQLYQSIFAQPTDISLLRRRRCIPPARLRCLSLTKLVNVLPEMRWAEGLKPSSVHAMASGARHIRKTLVCKRSSAGIGANDKILLLHLIQPVPLKHRLEPTTW